MLERLIKKVEDQIKAVEVGESIQVPGGIWGGIVENSFKHYNQMRKPPILMRDDRSRRIVVLVSGGIDSTVSWEMAQKRVSEEQIDALYVKIETGYEDYEIKALRALGISPRIIEASIEHNWERFGFVIPGRNLLFILYAAQWLQEQKTQGEVWVSPTTSEITQSGGDKSWNFYWYMNQFLNSLYYPVRLVYPLQNLTKTGAIRWWLGQGLSAERLLKTRTCQSNHRLHCGECQACLIRWVALYNTGLDKQQQWEKDPRETYLKNAIMKARVETAQAIEKKGYAVADDMMSKELAQEILNAHRAV